MITSLIIVAAIGLAGLITWLLHRSIATAPEGFEDSAGFHYGRLPRRFRRRSATVRLIRRVPSEVQLPIDLPMAEPRAR